MKNSHLAKFKVIQGLLSLVHPSALELKMMLMTERRGNDDEEMTERRGSDDEEVTTLDEDDRDDGEEAK